VADVDVARSGAAVARRISDDDGMLDTLVITWEALDGLVARLAEKTGRDHDLVLAITRGGLVPAGMLAYRLDLREILVAGAIFYLPQGGTHPAPVIGHFPDPALLAGQRVLVVDEVWETGETMTEVMARVRAAGGSPESAVIHNNPGRSRVGGAPDHWADTVEDWVTYPYKAGG
jgi:hypoxanthine phosphoribosyltransferase